MAIIAQKSLKSACELVATTAQLSNVVDSDIIYRQVITIRPARKEADLLDSIEPNALVRPQTQILESQDFKKWQRHQTDAVRQLSESEQLRRYADSVKRGLSGFCFSVSYFDETEKEVTVYENGQRVKRVVKAAWRKQEAAHLNGLATLDADKLTFDIRQWFAQFSEKQLRELGHVMDYVTSSGCGFKAVFIARPEWGNLIENARKMAELMGLPPIDESCKDASRLSFAPSRKAGDILFLDEELLVSYENPEYERLYGDAYRRGDSGRAQPAASNQVSTTQPQLRSLDVKEFSVDEEIMYRDVPITKIVDCLLDGKVPQPGERHKTSLIIADNLRYILDGNAKLIEKSLLCLPWVQDMVRERDENVAQTVKSALSYTEKQQMPRKLQEALIKAGVKPSEDDNKNAQLPYNVWANQLKRMITHLGCYICAIKFIVEWILRPGGIISSACMYVANLTDCWYINWEGRPQRINLLGLIIGPSRRGKGFAVVQDEAIMEPMRQDDAQGRDQERQFKRAQTKNEQSKDKEKRAVERPEAEIRYVPARTSNNILFRRMSNAVRIMADGSKFFKHIYMFCSELLSFVQARGDFQQKRDILLCSMSNERSGVDYANKDSINDTFPVHFIGIFTGTQVSLKNLINENNIGDGLEARFASFLMPERQFKMRPYQSKPQDTSHIDEMRMWAERFKSLQGEIKGLGRLTKHVYNICTAFNEDADNRGDEAALIMGLSMQDKLMAVCIPQVISTQPDWEEFKRTMTVRITQRHLDFASLMFDVMTKCEDALFGRLWQAHLDSAQLNENQPRTVSDNTAKNFLQLDEEFTTADVQRVWKYTSNATASTTIKDLCKKGYAEKISKGHFRKLVSKIE